MPAQAVTRTSPEMFVTSGWDFSVFPLEATSPAVFYSAGKRSFYYTTGPTPCWGWWVLVFFFFSQNWEHEKTNHSSNVEGDPWSTWFARGISEHLHQAKTNPVEQPPGETVGTAVLRGWQEWHRVVSTLSTTETVGWGTPAVRGFGVQAWAAQHAGVGLCKLQTQRGWAVLLGKVSVLLACCRAGVWLSGAWNHTSSEDNSAAALVALCRGCFKAHWRVTPFFFTGCGWALGAQEYPLQTTAHEIPCLGPCLNAPLLSHTPCKKRLWSFIPQASHHADEAKRVISTPCFAPSLLAHKHTVLLSQVAEGSALPQLTPSPACTFLPCHPLPPATLGTSAPPCRPQEPPAKSLAWHPGFLATVSHQGVRHHTWVAADKRCKFCKDLFTASCKLTQGSLVVNSGFL